MSDLNTERSKAWTIYTASDPAAAADEEVAPWKSSFGTSSMSAISFGIVATAILISMFLIMAIFEHLFKPSTPQFSSPESIPGSSPHDHQEPAPSAKHANPQTVASPSYECDMSVLMPGQQYPTYIAQPAPLPQPCPREGITYWPSQSHYHI